MKTVGVTGAIRAGGAWVIYGG
ncbi:hypothetical protein SPHV1_210022 [Novosphingobium sp. KN65.2]|nr:hypothetical protein SPHV1_210022 [Novosphingobium sp. KN65.2]